MSGTVIITKYSTSTGSPATDALAVGEQAYSFNSDKLFIGETSGSDVVARTIGGQFFTDMMDHTAGTLTASSAIIVATDIVWFFLQLCNQSFPCCPAHTHN